MAAVCDLHPICFTLLQVVLDLVNPWSVIDGLVNVLRPGAILAAYLPKLAPGNKYTEVCTVQC